MKKLNNCIVSNCIPTPSGCVQWDGGDTDFLGIKNGDFLPKVIWEIVAKLEEVTGDKLSEFDVDALLGICQEQAPAEIDLISILNLLKRNQVCLKDYLDTLHERLNDMSREDRIEINLRCYADMDSMGNPMAIQRKDLDQLIINELCGHEEDITSIQGSIVRIDEELENLRTRKVTNENTIATCVDDRVMPVSSHVKLLAQDYCDYKAVVGDAAAISSALAKTPSNWNQKYGTIPGWDATPNNWAEDYANVKLALENALARLEFIENNCCAADCDDIKLGFSAMLNETGDGILLRFSSGAGTKIPSGFVDKGSTGTITDMDGNVESFRIDISNNLEDEIFIDNLNRKGDLKVSINAKLGNGSLVCEKCLNRLVTTNGCGYCEITATGAEGASAVITYIDGTTNNTVIVPPVIEPSSPSTTTTTTFNPLSI